MPERISHSDMAFELQRLAYGKREWLQRFSFGKNKRPDHDIEARRHELRVLDQAAADYRQAAGRAVA